MSTKQIVRLTLISFLLLGAGAARSSGKEIAPLNITKAPFNAKCDGASDDGAAIGLAIRTIASHVATKGAGGKLVGCAGRIALVRTSIDATALNPGGYDSPLTLDFGGMVIRCETGDDACFDMTEDNYVHVRDLHLWGDSGARESKIGLQLVDPSDAGTTSSHENVFDELSITGYFRQAALYLESAEVNYFNSCYINDFDSHAVAAAVLDGYDHWASRSRYYRITRSVDRPKTFSGNVFACGGIQAVGKEPALWIGNALQQRFSIYSSTQGDSDIVLYQRSDAPENNNLSFDMHMEAFPWLKQDFLIAGPAENPQIPSLTFIDGADEARNFIFATAPQVKTVALYNLSLVVAGYNTGGNRPPPSLFDDPGKYRVTGNIVLPDPRMWRQPATFNGTLQDPGLSLTAARITAGNIILPTLPTTCDGKPRGTLIAKGNVLSICP